MANSRLAPRPVRRLRRWLRHSTNAEIGTTLVGVGCLLVVGAGALWYLA
jgi:hypothetical protein